MIRRTKFRHAFIDRVDVGSEKVYDCDMILLAMGFLGPEKNVINQLGLKQDERGNIQTPRGKYASSVAKVYAAGGMNRDCHSDYYSALRL